MDKAKLIHEFRSLTTLIYVKTHDYPAWRDVIRASTGEKDPLVACSEAQPWEPLRAAWGNDGTRWGGVDGKRIQTMTEALRAALQAIRFDRVHFLLVQGADRYFDNLEVLGLLREFADRSLIDPKQVAIVILFGTAALPEALAPLTKVVTDTGPTPAEIQEALERWTKDLMIKGFEINPEDFAGYSLFQIQAALFSALIATRKKIDRAAELIPRDAILMTLSELRKVYTKA